MRKNIYQGLGYIVLYFLILFLLWIIKWEFIALTPFTMAILSAIILINIYSLVNAIRFRTRKYILLLLIAYASFVVGILFLRNQNAEYQYTFKWYLTNWSKHLFSNRVIFINVIGNILLFIPLGLLIRGLYPTWMRYPLCLVLILILESIQFVTRLGVFDLVDVILNYFGILLGFVLYHLRKGVVYATR